MIKLLIGLARFFSMLQRGLGRGVTHLLTAAQQHGWKPENKDKLVELERRQIALAMRRQTIRLRKQTAKGNVVVVKRARKTKAAKGTRAS